MINSSQILHYKIIIGWCAHSMHSSYHRMQIARQFRYFMHCDKCGYWIPIQIVAFSVHFEHVAVRRHQSRLPHTQFFVFTFFFLPSIHNIGFFFFCLFVHNYIRQMRATITIPGTYGFWIDLSYSKQAIVRWNEMRFGHATAATVHTQYLAWNARITRRTMIT